MVGKWVVAPGGVWLVRGITETADGKQTWPVASFPIAMGSGGDDGHREAERLVADLRELVAAREANWGDGTSRAIELDPAYARSVTRPDVTHYEIVPVPQLRREDP